MRGEGERALTILAAYVYPGWHPIPERDESFHPGFTEWELVTASAPRFPGHVQPRLPLLGKYDDRAPAAVGERVRLAAAHGIDAFVFGTTFFLHYLEPDTRFGHGWLEAVARARGDARR